MKFAVLALIASASAMTVNKYSHRVTEPDSVEEQESNIEPYNQRDHAWTEGQYDMEDEFKWNNQTKR